MHGGTMTYLYLAQKFWRECIIAVLAFLLLICLFLLNSKTGKLEQAEAKCAAQSQKIELAQQTVLNQANDKANQVSADYEQLKATQQVKIQTLSKDNTHEWTFCNACGSITDVRFIS